jgi:hypothetical protein
MLPCSYHVGLQIMSLLPQNCSASQIDNVVWRPGVARSSAIGYGGADVGKVRGRMPVTRRKVLGGMSAAAILAVSPPTIISRVSAAANARLSGLACNMESWWTGLDFMERFKQAAASGFSAIEFWNYDVEGRDMAAVAALCRNLGLDVVQFTNGEEH